MITVRRMEEWDVAAAAKLESENFSEAWSEQSFLETLQCDYAYYYVAECEELEQMTDVSTEALYKNTAARKKQKKVVGICGLRNIAGEGEITNVVTNQAYRRQGIARTLLQKVLSDGVELGIEAFTLEVRCSNQPAIALYEKFGFESAGVRKNFYTNPKEDALIMWKR